MAFTLTREFYIPKGSCAIRDKHSDGVAYIYLHRGKPCADLFGGKRAKPDHSYIYRSEAERATSIARYFAALQDGAKRKSEWAAERTKPHTLKVGDILVASWGYEQTNVDYYQITEASLPRTVQLRKINGRMLDKESEGFRDAGYCVPVPDSFIEKEPTLTRRSNSTNSVRIDDVRYARPCEPGDRNYISWYY